MNETTDESRCVARDALLDAYDAAVLSAEATQERAAARQLFSLLSLEREIRRMCHDEDGKRELCALLDARVEAIPLIASDSLESTLRVDWLTEVGVAVSASPPPKYRRSNDRDEERMRSPSANSRAASTTVYDRIRRVHERRYGAVAPRFDGDDYGDDDVSPPAIVSEAALLTELTLRDKRARSTATDADYDAVYKDVLSVRYDVRRCALSVLMRRVRDEADRRYTDASMARANRLDEEEMFLRRQLDSAESTVRALYRELTSHRASNLPQRPDPSSYDNNDVEAVATLLRDAMAGLVTLHGNLTREVELMYNAMLSSAIAELERRYASFAAELDDDYGKLAAEVERAQLQRDEMVRSVRKLFIDELAMSVTTGDGDGRKDDDDGDRKDDDAGDDAAIVTAGDVLNADAARTALARLIGMTTRLERDVANVERMSAVEPSAVIRVGDGGLPNPLVGSADAIAATVANIVATVAGAFRENSEPSRRVRQWQARTIETLNRLREEEKRCERIFVTARITRSTDTRQYVRALTDYILRFRIAAQQERRSVLLYESVRSKARTSAPPKHMRWNVKFFDELARTLMYPYLDGDTVLSSTTTARLDDSKRQLFAHAIAHVQCARGYVATSLALGQEPNREIVALLLKSISLAAFRGYRDAGETPLRVAANRVLTARSRLLECVTDDEDDYDRGDDDTGDHRPGEDRISAKIRRNIASSSLQTRLFGFALACVIVPNYRQRHPLVPFRAGSSDVAASAR